MRDPGCDNDTVSPTPAQQARAAAIAAEITARLAAAAFSLPGTLADRMTRCGHPGCRCHAGSPRLGQHTGDPGLARPESGGEHGLLGCVAFHLVQQDFVGLAEHELHSR